jgi:glyoxylase-like metal-dependent hydrolase (beta-lactamase superfamily II)/8-oxo-dGTP pyrophosphatase MutT (NUDIX family)
MAQIPRPAATLILLRPGAGGPEVLMIQRTQSAAFLGGAYVFPGGSLEPQDSDPRLLKRIVGLTEAQANARLGLSSGAAPYYVAAIRECFEEAGVLLLFERNGKPIGKERAEQLTRYRQRALLELLEEEDLYIPAGALAYYGHWITQPGRARRFDTRFFVALAPEGQEGSHDAGEAIHQMWVLPREALERGARGEIELVFATQQSLKDLGRFADCNEIFSYVSSLKEIETNRACRAQGKDGERTFRRADPQYFEIHWSDPEETGTTSYDILPGVPKRLDRLVTRITAPNPGAMTGPGTNSYLVGEGDLAVIDPGPAVESHIEKILETAKGKLRWIICTHTHLDHSPAAAALKAATGAQVLGRPAPEGQDASFKADFVLENGQRVDLGGMTGSVTLRAIHTPGHASNHLCYLLEETRMLFTGDHIMQGSTVVINPPDGDMRAYLASLEALLAEDIAIIAPGHGYLIGAPHKEIRRLIAHRLARENKVKLALAQLRQASLEQLLPLVYDDVPERMHRWAARSLGAHLDKLLADGAVQTGLAGYTLVQSAPSRRDGRSGGSTGRRE